MADDIWFEGPEYLLAAALVGFAVLGTLVYVQMNPAAPWQFEAAYSSVFSMADSNEVTANTTLELPVEDAKYLNRAYTDLNVQRGDGVGEQGYCLSLVGNRLSVQQAGTVEASEERVVFRTANCLDPQAILHFHPQWSEPVLSGPDTSVDEEFNDKRALLESDFQFSCVMAGPIPEEPGKEPAALQCYLPPESGYIGDTFPAVPVEIVADT